MLTPHYKDEIKKAMEALACYMEEFKQKVLLTRLGAVTLVSKYFEVSKISDKMYLLPGGGYREQTALNRTGEYGGSRYREYRDTIKELYASYFDNAISQ